MLAESVEKVENYVELNQNHYVQKLAEAVSIPSVSGTVEHRPHVFAMANWLEKELLRLGATVSMRDIGSQNLEGKQINLPPVILAEYGTDPSKKTVLVYGHYDVQPALKEDGYFIFN